MNSTRKYEFILSQSEILEFCRVAMTEQLKRKKRMWVKLALLLLLAVLAVPKAAPAFALVIVAMILGVAATITANIKKTITGQKWIISLEDGMVKANRDVGGEMPCSRIELIRTTPHLLMFGYMQSAEQPAWYMIPLRVFENAQEQETFLDMLRRPHSTKNTYLINDGTDPDDGIGQKTDDSSEQEHFRFGYELNEEKWVHFHKGAFEILISGTIGKTGRIRNVFLYSVFMMVFLILVVYFAARRFSWWEIPYSVAIALLMTLRLFFRDPEKGLKKQMKSPVSRDRVCGKWRVLLKEEGVESAMPMGTKNYYPWESLEWFAEADDAFYLFQKDKKHYILIPKETIQDQGQASMLRQFCTQKGLKTVVQTKKVHYIPNWLFILLFVLFIVACIGIFSGSLFLSQQGFSHI